MNPVASVVGAGLRRLRRRVLHIRVGELGGLFGDAFWRWYARDPFRESAVIAYYAIFSLPGLLMLVHMLAGHFFGTDVVAQHLHGEISAAMGRATADQVQEMMNRAGSSRDSIWATVLGVSVLLVGATGVFVQLQKSLNVIWGVKASVSLSGVWTFFKARLFSFGLILSISFLLLVSLVVTSVLTAMSAWFESHWSGYFMFLFQLVTALISLTVISALFAMMFKLLPDAEVEWRFVWVGAFVTGLLFEAGKLGLGLYFGKADPGSGYGAAGSVILILLWVSYTSMIVFYGAEFTKAYADHFHGEVAAGENAVKVEEVVVVPVA